MTRTRAIVRRDAPVGCASCGREVVRRARQQRFCSDRCNERGRTRCRKITAVHALQSEPRYRSSRAPTNAAEKASNFDVAQGAKSRSSPHMLAPAQVVAAEVFGGAWHGVTSSDGVAIQTRCIRPRALVTSAAHALGDTP